MKLISLLGSLPVQEYAVASWYNVRWKDRETNDVVSSWITERYVVLVDRNNTLHSYDKRGLCAEVISAPKPYAMGCGHRALVTALCQTDEGYIVSGDSAGKIYLWNVQKDNTEILSSISIGHLCDDCSVLCSSDNGLIVGYSKKGHSGELFIWPYKAALEQNKLRNTAPQGYVRAFKGGVNAFCVARGGKIITSTVDGKLRIWDGGNQIAESRVCDNTVEMISESSDGVIVTGSADGTIALWNNDCTQRSTMKLDTVSRRLLMHMNGTNKLCSIASLSEKSDGVGMVALCDQTVQLYDRDGLLGQCICLKRSIVLGKGDNGKIISLEGNGLFDTRGYVRVWDIPFLRLLQNMNEKQAGLMNELIERLTPGIKDSLFTVNEQTCWQRVGEILEYHEPCAEVQKFFIEL